MFIAWMDVGLTRYPVSSSGDLEKILQIAIIIIHPEEAVPGIG
jgi:hypothetical protein